MARMDQLEGLTAWIVEDEDFTAAGHLDLTLDGRSARLGRVIIDPEKRGRGLAHSLIDLAIMKARELRASQLELNVIEGNLSAIRTYERAGFTARSTPVRPGVATMFLPLPIAAAKPPKHIGEHRGR